MSTIHADYPVTLEDTITAAWALYNNSEEGSGEGEYPVGSRSALADAINTAQQISNGNPDDDTTVQAIWDLNDACTTFEKEVQTYSVNLIDTNATRETRYLYSNLQMMSGRNLMFGMHDPTGYGVGWSNNDDRSDVRDVCGDFPAVSSWPTRHITLDEDVTRDHYRMTSSYGRGGINTMAWHQIDPDGRGFYAEDVNYENIVATLIPGGEHHDFYCAKLWRLANYLKGLRGYDGHAIPVIFRPYHEHDGTWFWWGDNQCTTEQYNQLWQFTVTYLRDSLNVHNLIYAISPGVFETREEYLEIFPGHEFVDIYGLDSYFDSSISEAEQQLFVAKLQVAAQLAIDYNKVAALTETGQETIPTLNFFTGQILEPLKFDPLAGNLVYAAVWRNAHTGHHYAPYPGHPSVPDFLEFYNDPYTLFEAELDMYNHNIEYAEPPVFIDYPQEYFTSYDMTFTIELQTNKPAMVKYSLADESYDSMPNEAQGGQGTVNHSATVSGIQGEEITWYFRARDANGLTMETSTAISFSVDTTYTLADWTEPLYVAENWQTGTAPFGYGNGDDETEVNEVNTVYFRKEFQVEDVDSVPYLAVFVYLHDGAVFYVNGHEVYRENMPAFGEINFNTYANSDAYTQRRINFPAETVDYLVNGTNVLAVEVHRSDDQNADISMDLDLIYGIFMFYFQSGSEWYYSDSGSTPDEQLIDLAIDNFGHLLPEGYELKQNYPNPFNPITTIEYSIPVITPVEINIMDIMGRQVSILQNPAESQLPGSHSITWSGDGHASGIYFVTFQAGDVRTHQKILLLK